jgi:Fe-S-cluster-containing dehydrogenase component
METAMDMKSGKRLTLDIDQCTGCRCCALACSYIKTGSYNTDDNCIPVLQFEESGVDCPVFCQQCEEPRCVEACPTNAMHRSPQSGLIDIADEKCDGCGACLAACPYGAITAAPTGYRRNGQVMKCDLCGGKPECVEWCETGAIRYAGADETTAIEKSRTDMLMAKKRYEIEHGVSLWRLRLRGRRVSTRKGRK